MPKNEQTPIYESLFVSNFTIADQVIDLGRLYDDDFINSLDPDSDIYSAYLSAHLAVRLNDLHQSRKYKKSRTCK